jgi:peptidoglycan/LPS O-acetylase OafA/YrhL
MNRPATVQGRRGEGPRLPHLSSLDGLRALAVIAVLLYHAQTSWLRGGFLGVDVFFVISGYLITSLLLVEWRQRGCIDLPAFWLRRARRLLPALFLLIGVTLAFAVVFLPGEVAGLRSYAAAALGYVTNWYLVFHQSSYFETIGRPSLFQHLWSLAVEEQFYILWPLLFTAMMRFWRPRQVVLVVLAGAAASALAMALLYRPDVDPSRLYYGTDTRAAGLLVGAALAFLWGPGQLEGRVGRANGLLLDILGFGALGVLVCFCLRIDGFQPFLYRGGFALVALTTAVVIAVAAHPRAHLMGGLLSRQPLRWIGLRSYGIYLWHWPIFMVTRPQLDVPLDGLPLLALRLAATLLIAELSYRLVETPIRTGALRRIWELLRETHRPLRRGPWWQWAGVASTVLATFGVLGASVASAHTPPLPSYLSAGAVDVISTPRPPSVVPAFVSPSATPVAPALNAVPPQDAPGSPQQPPPPTADATPTPQPTPPMVAAARASAVHVTAVGDSVMLSAANELAQAVGDIEVDAQVGRQVSAAISLLRAKADAGQLGEAVVIDLGTNGTFSASQFDEIMQVLGGTRRVVFVNLKVPRDWEGLNNAMLAQKVKDYPNAVLVDWHTASINQPQFFWDDGIHLRPEGAQVYAQLIVACLEAP